MPAPHCPACACDYPYEDRDHWVCPECGHEWIPAPDGNPDTADTDDGSPSALDANGNPLQNGDTVVLAKTLKVKGAQGDLKPGTKVKNIRIVTGDHNIDCRIDGFGAMKLKSEFVKKA